MSAPLQLSADQAHKLGSFLTALTKATVETGVLAGVSGAIDIELRSPENEGVKPGGGSSLRIAWDGTEYVVDDRVGS